MYIVVFYKVRLQFHRYFVLATQMQIHCWFVVLLLPFTATGCPEKEVPPCSCTLIGYRSSEITCSKADNDESLRDSIKNLRQSKIPIRSVTIVDSVLTYIPQNTFEGFSFEKLLLARSNFMSLSDGDRAFVGLENSLKVLIIQDCLLLSGWEWSHLSNLNSLVELRTVASGLTEIDEDIKEIAHLDISLLQLTQDSISFVHDTAFASFKHLKTLSLKRNEVSELKRSMFPDPANELQQLILGFNKLETLPQDMFTNMPKLISIVLEGNYFLSLDKKTFAPIWNQLTKINAMDNPLRCDCRIKWILLEKFPKNMWIECGNPDNLKGKDVRNLTTSDLIC